MIRKGAVGALIPAVIHNGSYFFIEMPVYGTGMIDCWGQVDLAEFREKLDAGWVVPSIPDGEAVSIHGLGSWKLTDAAWDHDTTTLHERCRAIIAGLQEHPTTIEGASISMFVREHDTYWLVELRAFADGSLRIDRLPKPERLTVDEVRAAVIAGRLLAAPPIGARVRVHGLGAFTLVEEQYANDIDDLVLEIPDLVAEAGDLPPSYRRAREAYKAYKAAPSDELLAALRAIYESVPKHNRLYCGDMDSKDWPIRRLLYPPKGYAPGEEVYEDADDDDELIDDD